MYRGHYHVKAGVHLVFYRYNNDFDSYILWNYLAIKHDPQIANKIKSKHS